jgi:hypothetical protein
MNKSLRFLVAAGLIGGGCWATSVWGQQDAQPGAPAERIKRPVDALANPVPAEEPVVVEDTLRPDQVLDEVRGFKASGGVGSGSGAARLYSRLLRRGGTMPFEATPAFQEAVEKLRSAKAGPEKEAAKKELLELLEQSFTRDLEHREKEVAEIELRVKKLREQIERRKKAKDEIVGLRLKTIVNETEGLGFSDSQDFELAGKHPAKKAPVLRSDSASDDFLPRPTLAPDETR